MITLNKAKQALVASENKAKQLGVAVTTTIVDTHGSIIAVSRMDGAIPISPNFSYEKAFTSASLGMPTSGLAEYAEEGKPYFGLTDIFGGKLTTIAGGLPVMRDGQVIGGVGVGGSAKVSEDEVCAKETLKILES